MPGTETRSHGPATRPSSPRRKSTTPRSRTRDRAERGRSRCATTAQRATRPACTSRIDRRNEEQARKGGLSLSSSRRRGKVVLQAEAVRRTGEYLQGVTRERLWRFARRWWFDALLLAFLGVGLAEAVVTQNDKNGPVGPMWFDILTVVGIVAPLFFRNRFP